MGFFEDQRERKMAKESKISVDLLRAILAEMQKQTALLEHMAGVRRRGG